MIDNIKRYNKLLELQKCFEEGIIKEEDLSEEQKSSLEELYKKQIEDLQRNIDKNKNDLKLYKEKIVNIRKKMHQQKAV